MESNSRAPAFEMNEKEEEIVHQKKRALYLFLNNLYLFLNRGGSTPGCARSNDLAGRSTALAPPCLALRIYHIAALFVYFDGETALAACVLRATTKKGRQFFISKKSEFG